jgi:hypothetical protein
MLSFGGAHCLQTFYTFLAVGILFITILPSVRGLLKKNTHVYYFDNFRNHYFTDTIY